MRARATISFISRTPDSAVNGKEMGCAVFFAGDCKQVRIK